MEKTIKPISGFIAVFICLGLLFYCIYNFLNVDKGIGYGIGGTICIVAFVFLAKGLMIIQPNHSRILTFCGIRKKQWFVFCKPTVCYQSYKFAVTKFSGTNTESK